MGLTPVRPPGKEAAMRRLVAVSVLLAALAAFAAAADYSEQLEREYTDRLLTMDDSPAGHVALARWCEGVGLAEKAVRHWNEALFRDADHKEARAALGFGRRGLEWVKAGEDPAAGAMDPAIFGRPAPVPLDPERHRALERRIQGIYATYLGATDDETWTEGAREMLMVRDPAAADIVHRVLAAGDERTRRLMCDVLGQLPGPEAARRLVCVLLQDPAESVFHAALKDIDMRSDDYCVGALLNGLNGSEQVLRRAAYALGELGEWEAVPRLIGRLRTPEPRLTTYDAPRRGSAADGPGAYYFSGTIVTYIADVEPVVSEGAVAFNPVIGAIPVGACLVVENPRVTIHRTIIEIVHQPRVREALRKITGRDFEFDEDAWRRWLREHEQERDRERREAYPPLP